MKRRELASPRGKTRRFAPPSEIESIIVLAAPNSALYEEARNNLGNTNVMSAASSEHIATVIKDHSVSRVLVDMSAAETRKATADLTYEVRQSLPHTPILACSTPDAYGVAAAYSSGADYVVPGPPNELLLNISSTKEANRRAELSKRQAQVLFGLAAGRSNIQVAQEIFVAPQTVKSYAKSLYATFGAHTRLTAVHAAFRRGMLASPVKSHGGARFPLTAQETLTIFMLAETGSREAAAAALGRSPYTLKTHVQNVRRKTGWLCTQALSNIWWWGQAPLLIERNLLH